MRIKIQNWHCNYSFLSRGQQGVAYNIGPWATSPPPFKFNQGPGGARSTDLYIARKGTKRGIFSAGRQGGGV